MLKKRLKEGWFKRERIISKSIPSFFLLIIFGFFFLASFLYPKCSDDFSYSFIFGGGGIRPTGLYDIFTSQIKHYTVCNGRFWTHFVVQSLLMIDKIFFAILNVIVYAFCTYFFAFLGKKSLSIWRWSIIALTFWSLMPATGSSLFWLTGSINYLWASCLNAFLLSWIWSGKKIHLSLLLLISLIAGNAHEGISVGILMIMVCLLLVRRRNIKMHLLMLAAYTVGLLLNIISPGNFFRLGTNYGNENFFLGLLSKLYPNGKSALALISNQPEIAFSGFILLFASIVCLYYSFVNKAKAVIIGAFIVGATINLTFVILSGAIYSRALYGFCFICYMLICIMTPLLFKHKRIHLVSTVVIIIALFLNFSEVPKAIFAIKAMRTMLNRVRNETTKGSFYVLPFRNFLSADRRYLETWGLGNNCIYSRPIARYYGGSEFIVPNNKEYLFLQKHLSQIANLPTNRVISLPNDYYVLRLTCVPSKIAGTLPAKEKPHKIGFIRKITQNIPLPIYPMVFCYQANYYVVWQTNEKGSIISIKTNEGTCIDFYAPS